VSIDTTSVTVLVSQANGGSQQAWNAIVDRYASLVWSICQRFRLSEADAADVSQTVWLRLVEQLPSLREAAALPGWLSTTTRRECIKVSKQGQRSGVGWEDMFENMAADEDTTSLDAELLAAERRAMVREGFTQLPEHCQKLLALLVEEDHEGYARISERLDMPVGSIGPTRSRCLDKLRSCPALATWLGADIPSAAATRPAGRRTTEGPQGGRHV
jgi:RNA polymerase sigma factor (sigma-70 family)